MSIPFVTTYIGLGSNVGDREGHMRAALAWLRSVPDIRLETHTGIIETAPWGVTDQPRFLNAVARIATRLTPQALLRELKSAELRLGRDPAGPRWGPRVIDLDILLFGDVVLTTPSLTLPHPRIVERPFVLEQLLELDRDLFHPALDRPLSYFLPSGL